MKGTETLCKHNIKQGPRVHEKHFYVMDMNKSRNITRVSLRHYTHGPQNFFFGTLFWQHLQNVEGCNQIGWFGDWRFMHLCTLNLSGNASLITQWSFLELDLKKVIAHRILFWKICYMTGWENQIIMRVSQLPIKRCVIVHGILSTLLFSVKVSGYWQHLLKKFTRKAWTLQVWLISLVNNLKPPITFRCMVRHDA